MTLYISKYVEDNRLYRQQVFGNVAHFRFEQLKTSPIFLMNMLLIKDKWKFEFNACSGS